MATVTGTYMISILLSGEHIKGSPYAARVVRAGPDPSQCRVVAPAGEITGYISYQEAVNTDGPGGEVYAAAGDAACFDLSFHDALGRGVSMDESSLRLSITPWRSLQDALASLHATAVVVPPTRIDHDHRHH